MSESSDRSSVAFLLSTICADENNPASSEFERIDQSLFSYPGHSPDAAKMILSVDHACARIPTRFHNLGLMLPDLSRHIAFDIGVTSLAIRLSNLMSVPAIGSRFSRLLIDPNRGLDDPTLIPQIADGTLIPGNRDLTPTDIRHRLDTCYIPYHRYLDAKIVSAHRIGSAPVLIALHSFSPSLMGQHRPWKVAVLWDRSFDIAHRLADALERADVGPVGRNEPYDGGMDGSSLVRHGRRRHVPGILIEVRNDQLLSEPCIERWASTLADALCVAISDRV